MCDICKFDNFQSLAKAKFKKRIQTQTIFDRKTNHCKAHRIATFKTLPFRIVNQFNEFIR